MKLEKFTKCPSGQIVKYKLKKKKKKKEKKNVRAATNNTFTNFAPACICYSDFQSGFTFVNEYANKIFEIIRVPRVQFRLNQNAIIWLYIDLMFLVVSGIERYRNLEFKVPIRNIAADSCDGEKSPIISDLRTL